MAKHVIVYRPIEDLRPHPDNARIHSKKQIADIAKSIKRWDVTNPPLIDNQGFIIAGHGRVLAAKSLGLTEMPTISLSDMSEDDIRAYRIADNRLAEGASWDRAILGSELDYLSKLSGDLDLTLTGFNRAEIDVLLQEISNPTGSDDPADALPAASKGEPVTRLGDVWEIGPHRLICGDSQRRETYALLMNGETAGMGFADAPFNVPISGHVSGLGQTTHAEFAMASGEMSSVEFTAFLKAVFEQMVEVSRAGAIHYQFMDWRHAEEMIDAGKAIYSELKNICVWTKTNGGMGSLYRSAHELVFVWKAGTAPHVNNIELGKNGRYRTNCWAYPGANAFGGTRDEDLANHPTVKPVALVGDAILDCSLRGDIILDPFMGSGTTFIAAQKTGRRAYGVEIDPGYCDLILRRLKPLVKAEAILVGDGRTFDQVAAARGEGSVDAGA